jgi:hypothetical protein
VNGNAVQVGRAITVRIFPNQGMAYVRLERAIALARVQHHGPLSNQLGSSSEFGASSIQLYTELKEHFVEV